MLVLSRTLGQRIIVGENVIVTVLGSKNGQVRLGIEAPQHVKILREELEMQREMPIQVRHEHLSRPRAFSAGEFAI